MDYREVIDGWLGWRVIYLLSFVPELSEGMQDMTFGEAITQARKERKLSQKEVAAATLKEDGESISAQYLNDIEHDRRNPPGGAIIRQLATILDLDADYLFFLAGRLPSDVLELSLDREDISQAMRAFRRNLRSGNR